VLAIDEELSFDRVVGEDNALAKLDDAGAARVLDVRRQSVVHPDASGPVEGEGVVRVVSAKGAVAGRVEEAVVRAAVARTVSAAAVVDDDVAVLALVARRDCHVRTSIRSGIDNNGETTIAIILAVHAVRNGEPIGAALVRILRGGGAGEGDPPDQEHDDRRHRGDDPRKVDGSITVCHGRVLRAGTLSRALVSSSWYELIAWPVANRFAPFEQSHPR